MRGLLDTSKRLQMIVLSRSFRFALFIALFFLLVPAFSVEPGGKPGQSSESAPRELVVMSYNIMVGRFHQSTGQYKGFAENLEALIEVIRRAGPDVVLLQEVDVGVERSERVDEAAHLAKALGMEYRFAPAIEFQGGRYGIALLSRWPIQEHEVIRLFNPEYARTHPEWRLTNAGLSEQRVLQIARIDVRGRSVSVMNTHLGLSQHQRRIQLARIGAYVEEHLMLPNRALIFGGDLNCEPDALELSPIRKRLRDAYHQIPDERGIPRDLPIHQRLTVRSDRPRACIDYIFVSDGHLAVLGTEVLETTASDHRPVVTRLAFR